jgi:glycosyltransferase involved in cell wall biosynthesis
MGSTSNDEADSSAIADAAISSFEAEYGAGPGKPVAVLMAAFNEVESVAAVVAAIPPIVSGLETETIVIDDGSTDGTADVAREAGALICRLEHNQGQGRAFRAGYRLAISRGATYIATIDADGQFDPSEISRLVGPLVDGEADFVNGSRRLGRAETNDAVRKAGVVFFGRLITLLTGVRITDPSNGLRAFRTEVVKQVPLRQAQYQTSELLIGAIARGFRVREAPVTVFARQAGTTKKGRNLIYGLRFSRVVITTWWNQRRAHS